MVLNWYKFISFHWNICGAFLNFSTVSGRRSHIEVPLFLVKHIANRNACLWVFIIFWSCMSMRIRNSFRMQAYTTLILSFLLLLVIISLLHSWHFGIFKNSIFAINFPIKQDMFFFLWVFNVMTYVAMLIGRQLTGTCKFARNEQVLVCLQKEC